MVEGGGELLPAARRKIYEAVKDLREGIVRTDYRRPARRRQTLNALLAWLLVFGFCAMATQFAARGNQSSRQIVEEETHEDHSRQSKVVISSWRKAPQRCPLAQSRPAARAALKPVREQLSRVAGCWNAHSYSRRGPPSSLPLS